MAAAVLALILASAIVHVSNTESVVGPAVRGEFQSCPGCSLNRLPEVKRFLREDIEKGAYKDVTVKFIPGRVPEFILFDAGDQEVMRMGVSKLSYQDLHHLVQSKGFRKKEDASSAVAGGQGAAATVQRKRLR